LKSLQLINVHQQHIHGVPRENNKTYLKQSTQVFVYFLRFSVSGLLHVLQCIKQTVPNATIQAYGDRSAQTTEEYTEQPRTADIRVETQSHYLQDRSKQRYNSCALYLEHVTMCSAFYFISES
jgi:hypothetical protein